jgi:hypothetical protein
MSGPAADPALAGLQREFQDYVLHRAPAVLKRVRATGSADAATRMDVYADGYVLRLLEALQSDYAGLAAIAGDDGFDALGRAFIAATPSFFRNLRWYGGGLPAFLASTPPWSERKELADMARFEWAMATVFDAPDVHALQREDLGSVDPQHWPRLAFSVHPAVQRVALVTDVPAAWSAQARGEPLPPLPPQVATTWLLTRRQLQVRFRAMAATEAAAFESLAAGRSFAQWCGELGEAVGQDAAALQAVQWLGQWLADGALAGFSIEAD